MYLKPVIIEKRIIEDQFWVPALFWCSALIIFVVLLLIFWCVMCYTKKKYITRTVEDKNGMLNSSTIHSENNKNIKDRVQMTELKLKSEPDAYQDIQDVFLRPNKDKPKANTATQTSDAFVDNVISTPSSPREFAFNDELRSSRRLSSCYSCSKSIPDDDMVNIFLNQIWTNDRDMSDVKFEVVGKSVNQAKRFQISEIENIPTDTTDTTDTQEKSLDISIPVRHSARIKSEIFIMINDDSTVHEVNGSDDVFK